MAHRAEGLNDIFEHDVIVRDNLHTTGGTIQDTPINDKDLVNKEYVDGNDHWENDVTDAYIYLKKLTHKVAIGNNNPTDFLAGRNNLVIGDGVGSTGLTLYAASNGQSIINCADGNSGTASYIGGMAYNYYINRWNWYTNNYYQMYFKDGDLSLAEASPETYAPNGYTTGLYSSLIMAKTNSTAGDSGFSAHRSDNVTGINVWQDSATGMTYIDSKYDAAASVARGMLERVRTK